MKLGVSKRRDQSRFGAIDYALMAAGNCLAAYSAGMAMNQPEIALFFVYAILGGSLFSMLVRRLFGHTTFVMVDSFLYAGATISAVLLTADLNTFLPGDGIPPEVYTAGWLCWMLAFGSALTWRDRTLLFQAVPTIALFGLVGCYDTYASAPFLFFGFLLCLATLLGRSHSREMLRQAVESGYFNRADAPNTPTSYPEQSPELYEDIKKGPWKRLAGPEWALFSGLAIVLVSLISAPAIRIAVQPLSGVIKVAVPRRMVRPNQQVAPIPSAYSSGYEVGRGPLFQQQSKPTTLFIAEMDKPRYLRTATFDAYTGHGWKSSFPAVVPRTDGPTNFAISEMVNARAYHISLQPMISSLQILPLPAEPVSVSPGIIHGDGGGSILDIQNTKIEIDAVEATAFPKDAEKKLPPIMAPLLDQAGIAPGVKAFADKAVQGKVTDFDKATAIMTAISSRCKYSLLASAVPPGEDAADWFLNQSKVGYCDLFATAMATCARAEGLPARYAVGYLPDFQNSNGTTTVIVDRDYHAWAEVFFKGVGWVVFDATAGATSLDSDSGSGWGVKWTWLTGALNTLIELSVVAIVGGWLFVTFRRRSIKKTVRSEVEKEYLVFSRALLRLSSRRRKPSETPNEYLDAVRFALNGSTQSAELLTRKFNFVLFGQESISDDTLKELRSEVRDFVVASKKSKT